MNSKQDILNAFREFYDQDIRDVIEPLDKGVVGELSRSNVIYLCLSNFLLNTLTEFEREIYKEVDKKIWEVIDSNMKHVSDGIYDWKEDPKHVFFADNLKNSLKNITFELEKEKRT